MLILDSLRVIEDRRGDRTKRHSRELILFVAVCAYLCGCEGFNEIELFAEANGEWLRAGLGMSGKSNGITAIPQLMDLLDLKGMRDHRGRAHHPEGRGEGRGLAAAAEGQPPARGGESRFIHGSPRRRTAPGVDGGSQKTYDKLL